MPTTVGQDRLAGAPNTQPGGAGRTLPNAQGTQFLPTLSCLEVPLSQTSHPVPVASPCPPPHSPGPGRGAGWPYCKTVREGAAFCAVICQHYGFSTDEEGDLTYDSPQDIGVSCPLSSMVCTTLGMARFLGNAAAFPGEVSRHNFFNSLHFVF